MSVISSHQPGRLVWLFTFMPKALCGKVCCSLRLLLLEVKCYNWRAPLTCFPHALFALIPSLPQASHPESPLYIKHYQYTGWPDHGVPLQPSSLVKFIQQVRKEVEVNGAPIVVHCR